SVSMLAWGSTMVRDVRCVKRSGIDRLPSENTRIGEMPGDGARCGGCRAREDRARAFALAAFEIAVRRRHGELARANDVAVHGDAHRAARQTPFGAGFDEDAIEPFCLRLALDRLRTGHDQHAYAVLYSAPAEDAGGVAQVRETAICARADKDDS